MLFELNNLRKSYGPFQALKGLTLKLDSQATGLLGPNGAGKSTLLKSLLGLLPFEGSAQVLGMSLPEQALEVRRSVGYMPENDCYLPYMTAIDYVSFNGQLCGLPAKHAFRRAHEVLFYVGLEEARYRQLGGFSTGMKQRAKLAQALVHGPKLLFLDEPTNGLDPAGRDEMLELIEDVKTRDIAIVLSTHLLPDVERICDSVMMLNEGSLVHCGPLDALQTGEEELIEVQTHLKDQVFKEHLEAANFEVVSEADRLKVRVPSDKSLDDLLRLARDKDIEIRHFMPERLTLETAFLRLLDEANASPAPEA